MQCLVNTIQSCSTQDDPLKIIVVGTHIDKLESKEDNQNQEENTNGHVLTETLEEKINRC